MTGGIRQMYFSRILGLICSISFFLTVLVFSPLQAKELSNVADCWHGGPCTASNGNPDYACKNYSAGTTGSWAACQLEGPGIPTDLPVLAHRVMVDGCATVGTTITMNVNSQTAASAVSSENCTCGFLGLETNGYGVIQDPGPVPGYTPGYTSGNTLSVSWTGSSQGNICIVSAVVGSYVPDVKFVSPGPSTNSKVIISEGTSTVEALVTHPTTNQIMSGVPIYFRIVDPYDPSPYVNRTPPQNYDQENGDNRGGVAGRRATLGGNGITETANGSNIWKATSGNDGKIRLVLQIPGSNNNPASSSYPAAASGDNYQIQASYYPDFGESFFAIKSPNAGSSGIITAWKLYYLERDPMTRQGGLLAVDAHLGDSTITLEGSNFYLPTCRTSPPKKGQSPCYQIAIFDSQKPYEATWDKPYVSWVGVDPFGRLVLHLSKQDTTTYYLMDGTYHFSDTTFSSGNSAAIAVLGSGFFSPPDTAVTRQPFDEVFVEFRDAPTGNGIVPFMAPTFFNSPTNDTAILNFARIWFANCNKWAGSTWACHPNEYFYIAGAKANTLPANLAAMTWKGNAHCTFLYIDRMVAAGFDDVAIGETHNHELGHHFGVNVLCRQDGHDLNDAWCSSELDYNCGLGFNRKIAAEPCVMNEARTLSERKDGVTRFDVTGLGPSCPADIFAIRTEQDPPQ